MSVNSLMMARLSGGSILYSVIARSTVILANHALYYGNFTEVTQRVLEHINTDTDSRLSYACGDYMYHYVCEAGVIYLCITDEEFERSRAFLFLENIKSRFQQAYGRSIYTAKPYTMNAEFSCELAKEMRLCTETSVSLVNLEGRNTHLEEIGIQNFDLSSGIDLEPLEIESDTESLLTRSQESYRNIIIQQTSRCTKLCHNHTKVIGLILFLVVLVVVIAIAVALGVCGKKCL